MTLRRRFRRARRRVGGVVLGAIGPAVIGGLARSWRTDVHGREHLQSLGEGKGCMIAIWHGRMLLGMEQYGGKQWNVLVSKSDDGSLIMRLLAHFGYRVIRGSKGASQKGGARALREMLAVLEAGEYIVVTPDGPRGPRHEMSPGLAWMARATGFPVVPLGLAVDRAWRLSSWDRFTIPKPRARVVLEFEAPVHVSREGGRAELDAATHTIKERILAAERRAFERLGQEPDW
jgi:lysophospholipid acyltransferase (LPLAT)-like uncharacterized protein